MAAGTVAAVIFLLALGPPWGTQATLAFAVSPAPMQAPGEAPLETSGLGGAPRQDSEVAGAGSNVSGRWGLLLILFGSVGLVWALRLWRLPSRVPLPLAGGAATALGLAAAAILMQPFGAALLLWLGGGSGDAGLGLKEKALAMAGALLAQVPVAVVVLRTAHRDPDRWPWPWTVLLGLATALLALPAVMSTAALASAVRESLTGAPSEVIAHDTLRMIVETPGPWSAVLSALAILGAPIMEEVLYRGLGHDLLRRLGGGPWTIVSVAAALFALAHWSVVTAPALLALFVLGLAFGWARERTGGLTAPIVAHALFNGLNLWLAG